MKRYIFILIGLFSFMSHGQGDTSVLLDGSIGSELAYSWPSKVNLDSVYIYSRVDSIMNEGIKQTAFPGAQLLVAKEGKIIFHEAYGFHTYDSLQPVALNDIYDLASVTKIAGPLPALMKLVDEKKLDLDAPFSNYWRSWKGKKDKKDLTLREILAHQAGLEPYIVFLNTVMKKDRLKKRFIQPVKSNRFQKQAYDGIFVKNKFQNKMHRMIRRSEVNEDKKYRYSGLTFLIFPQLIEQLTGMTYERYLRETIYDPLGCYTLGFNPDRWQVTNNIVPTEIDTLYRKTLTHGWVHDENASLLGGVSGNAGLFATALDLAKLMQLYQNYGSFNGQRILSESTMKEFTAIQFANNENRRGLGFDKPLLDNSELSLSDAYPAPNAAANSFGHSGFTGTFVWADPKNQLVFIFLSNRVYPSRSHRKLYSLNIRTALHQVFYEAAND
ncbi:serine hydrolase domain-containing protein [Muriicola sp. Z0-33]|uniref:serine hydrolase domain-containing protein n=1 Tax=Muriicola sp. Z0-33 TaxID=2816957 RepID=UPI002238608C|nr:serine hydrolase domain-containing protein [Muriicola sp. Z0-33]MCW5516347.1 beta-lactamase family protein [Muriicola sp. Z0-33]